MSAADITYVQILTKSGFVHDVSVETWSLVKAEIDKGCAWVEFEDIYGGEIGLVASQLDSVRKTTPETCERYRELHPKFEEE